MRGRTMDGPRGDAVPRRASSVPLRRRCRAPVAVPAAALRPAATIKKNLAPTGDQRIFKSSGGTHFFLGVLGRGYGGLLSHTKKNFPRE